MSSLESSIDNLAEAFAGLTQAIKENTSLFKDRNGSAQGSADAKPSASAKPSAAAKPVAAAAKTGVAKPSSSKPKHPPVEDIVNAFTGFLDVEDTDEEAVRKEFVYAVASHFGVKKASLIAPENRQQALDWLAARIEDADFEIPTEDDNAV